MSCPAGIHMTFQLVLSVNLCLLDKPIPTVLHCLYGKSFLFQLPDCLPYRCAGDTESFTELLPRHIIPSLPQNRQNF